KLGAMSEIGEVDEYLFAQGTHRATYEVLGAHVESLEGVPGTRFAVWAPNADEVGVTGGFNDWSKARTVLKLLGNSGIWEGFVPGVTAGESYKYSIRPRGAAYRLEKADPYAFAAEMRPATASIVTDLEGFAWSD